MDTVDLRVHTILVEAAREVYIGRTGRDDEYDSEDEPVNEDEPRSPGEEARDSSTLGG